MRIIDNNNFLKDFKKAVILFLIFIIPIIFAGEVKKQGHELSNTVSSDQIPAAEAAGETSVAYMGDARPSKFGTNGITELKNDFNQVVAQSPTGKVGAVFLIGDFDKISQTQQAYNASTLKTAQPPIPIFYVMGNHEVDDDNPDLLRQFFPYPSSGVTLTPGPNGTQSTTYSADIGNMHIVNLNVYWDGGTGSSSYTQRDGDVVPALRNWLSANLISSPSACKVVLAHEPLYPKNRHTGDSLNKYAANRDALQALFVAEKVGVFVGAHTHYAVVTDHGGVWHTDAGVSGYKTEDGEDPFASIFYTHVNSAGQMILTWKKGSGSSWSTGGTYTAQCGGGGPDTTLPTVAITCPSNNATVNNAAINVVGTAADNVAVSKVQVKLGPSGTWVDAQTSNNWANWYVSNFAIVLGMNTIYAQAIDTSGNTTPLNSVFIQVFREAVPIPSPGGGVCPEIGNFNYNGASAGARPELTIDVGSMGGKRSGVPMIAQSFSGFNFTWAQSDIKTRFTLGENAAKNGATAIAFLMHEEYTKPSSMSWTGVPASSANGSAYTITGSDGYVYGTIPAMPGAGENAYIAALLTAWNKMAEHLNVKSAIIAANADCTNDGTWDYLWGPPAVSYIAANYDYYVMYHYPRSLAEAQGGVCGSLTPPGRKDAASQINFWKGKSFQGKIIYIATSKFGSQGSVDQNVVAADFKSAADAGANYIVTYPYKDIADDGTDFSAIQRLVDIWNAYKAAGCTAPVNLTPLCDLPGTGPCTPSCPSGCAAVGQGDGCGGTCPNNTGTSCDDNNACTLGDICSGGSCQSGTPKTCGSTNPCVGYSCNTSTGNCEYSNKDGTTCDDGNKCTLTDICSGGLCRGVPMNCGDGEACTIDFCTDGTCKNTDVCGGLVPCGRLVDNPATNEINEKAPCNLCTAIYMIKELINFAVKIAFALALLSLVIAGFLYFTSLGDSHQVQKAKRILYYTAVGLIVVFLSWLGIAAVLQAFGYANISTWNQVNCSIVVDPSPSPIPSVSPSTGPIPSINPSPSASPSPTASPGPTPGPLPASCTHLVYNEGGQVKGKLISTGQVVVTGTLNAVLSGSGSGIGKSGNHICIQKGSYNLSTITNMQSNVIMECEYQNDSNRAFITGSAPSSDSQLIRIYNDSIIKNCTFDHKGFTIAAIGDVNRWRVENNYFINSVIAVFVQNTTTSSSPTSGHGFILNNKGLHSKLSTMQGTTDIKITGNSFADRNGPEQVDFNYNVHNVLMEYNTFINGPGFTLSEEVIDMIGGNSFTNSNNIVRYNTIIGAFRSGIRPAKSANDNVLDHNYIKFIQGSSSVVNVAGIYLYGAGNVFSTPKNNTITNNTIIGTKVGIELSGTNDNTVTGNNISATGKGIAIVKDSSSGYGAPQAAKNNTVTGNTIDNVDYGIYVQSSLLTNTITPNTITNFNIKAIEIIP